MVPRKALSGLALSQTMKSFRSFAGIVLLCRDHLATARHYRNGLEGCAQVVRKLIARAVDDVRAPMAADEHVAIRGRARDPSDTDVAAGAHDVFDHNRLPE